MNRQLGSTTRRAFRALGTDGRDVTDDLIQFVEWIGLESVAPARWSILLALGLFGGFMSRTQNPAKVVHEIRCLEGAEHRSNLKPAAPFRHPPLIGLWHKHYQEDGLRSFALNLKKGIKQDGLPILARWVNESKQTGVDRYLAEEDARIIAQEAVANNFIRLSHTRRITGEWIVYAKYDGVNYYLCLGNHDRKQHADLRKQIESVCCEEFAFLRDVLRAG